MRTIYSAFSTSGALLLTSALAMLHCQDTGSVAVDMGDAAADMSMIGPLDPPVITSLSPSFGANNVDTKISITGSGFQVGATVTVGSQACGNPAVMSATLILCTVPATLKRCSSESIGVTNPDGAQATSASRFSFLSATFSLSLPRKSGLTIAPMGPSRAALGDFNKDGNLDVVAVSGISTYLLSLGKGDGTFNPATPTGSGGTMDDVKTVDLNGDGNLDFVILDSSKAGIYSFVNTGSGTFTSFFSGSGTGVTIPLSMAIGELSGDTFADVVVGSSNSSNIGVLISNGDGTFKPATTITTTGQVAGVAIADFDGVAGGDIAVVDRASASVNVVTGNNNGTFATSKKGGTACVTPKEIVAADVTKDGRSDVVVTCGGTMGLLAGKGDGSFLPVQTFTTSSQSSGLVIADLNGDGRADAVVTDRSARNLYFLPGQGSTGFGTTINFPTVGDSPVGLAVGDLNNDQLPDVLVADNAMAIGTSVGVNAVLQLCK